MATQTNLTASLSDLSRQIAGLVEQAGRSVVRIDDGTRLTASGIVWSADGIIVGTSHGVERDEQNVVQLADGSRHDAEVVGRDPESDIAVLRIAGTDLPVMSIASEDDVNIGSLVLAIGRPGSGDLHATLGIVTARMEVQDAGRPEFILHTDAALYPGFSGGALVDADGRLAGMLNLMFWRGSGIAVGAPIVSHVVDALLAHGRIRRAHLGVGTQAVTLPGNLKQALGLSQEYGLMLVHVQPDSPAERGGLTIGDILVSANDTTLDDVDHLRRVLRGLAGGQAVTLRVIRGGALQEVQATLGDEA